MKVAITGGIGSGKSFVCERLQHFGIDVYDCDKAAKMLIHTSIDIQKQLSDLVGTNIFVNGKLQKAELASFLLHDKANAQAINNIIHPAVAAPVSPQPHRRTHLVHRAALCLCGCHPAVWPGGGGVVGGVRHVRVKS